MGCSKSSSWIVGSSPISTLMSSSLNGVYSACATAAGLGPTGGFDIADAFPLLANFFFLGIVTFFHSVVAGIDGAVSRTATDVDYLFSSSCCYILGGSSISSKFEGSSSIPPPSPPAEIRLKSSRLPSRLRSYKPTIYVGCSETFGWWLKTSMLSS